jgi:hypothetical protein
MCTVLLPPGVTQFQLNISYRILSYHTISYHISYHIIPYHIISYYIIAYYIISYYIIYHIISYIISYHITSYHIISYNTILHHMWKLLRVVNLSWLSADLDGIYFVWSRGFIAYFFRSTAGTRAPPPVLLDTGDDYDDPDDN